MVNWKPEDLRQIFKNLNFAKVKLEVESTRAEFRITASLIERWFSQSETRKTYQDRLAAVLKPEEVKEVYKIFKERFQNRRVIWEGQVAYISAEKYSVKKPEHST